MPIHCSEPVMQAISIPIHCTEQLLPYKYDSLKTIFLSMRNPNVINNAGYHLNSYGSQHISHFSLRCGRKIIPPSRAKCPQAQNNIEAFEELKKSFHAGGNA